MLFGILCTYVLAYGAGILFSNVISFVPKTIQTGTRYLINEAEEIKTKDLKQSPDSGILESSELVLTELYPTLKTFNIEALTPFLQHSYWLTRKERQELEMLLSPILVFELLSSTQMSSVVKDIQRRKSIEPVILFLSRIPEIRRGDLRTKNE